MDKLKALLCSLEERLVEHDENREVVQSVLKETCSKINKDSNSFEEKVSEEISVDFKRREEQILGLIEKLNEEEGDLNAVMEKAKKELSKEWKYEIQECEDAESFVESYKLKISSVKVERKIDISNAESIVNQLQEHLDRLQQNMSDTQEELAEICSERRSEAVELERIVNERLEVLFSQEDARIQGVVKMVKENIDSENPDEIKELTRKAKLTLLMSQKYSLAEGESLDNYNFEVEKEVSLKSIDFEERRPMSLIPSFTEKGEFLLSFAFFDEDEVEVLKEVGSHFEAEVKVWEKGHEEDTSRTLTKELTLGSGDEPIFLRSTFAASTTYCLNARIAYQGMKTQWSDEAEFTPEFKECCVWKECPDYVYEWNKYSVAVENPRIAKNLNYDHYTIIGNTSLPLGNVTSWSIKILKSKRNDGNGIYIGVAPSDIDQNERYNYDKCGWYFDCRNSKLCSGPPHNYMYPGKEYGARKGGGEYVHTGDSVGVVMDTTKGELSFVLNGVNLGVAYEGIPLDKPLVPCVLLENQGDSVELDTSEVRENVNSSIPVPSNITTKSITWDSIALTWDAVEGASFYQIEVDGNKMWKISISNTFTKRRLLPETEHTFRVRAVKGNSVSEWSDVVRGRTQKAQDFLECTWKKCPDDVDEKKKYFLDENNPRIAIKSGKNGWCTIIGNTPLPLNKVTSWSIKILKSKFNDGVGILIGVAPFDIYQNEPDNYKKYGWYFNSLDSTLWSGPPHRYWDKEYGPRKGNGQYVHTGDSVGVVMDTVKGELSFVLNGVNLGVAYEGFPLDKPLVPCIPLCYEGDSVELVI